jgi:predicted GNAT family N-acyltransferase
MMAIDSARQSEDIRVSMVRNLSDFMQVVALRSAVFLAEQDCPYDEEFDNNDLCAAHLLAYQRGEPVATLRIRWFAGWAKIERVCVKKQVRGGGVVKALIEKAVEIISRKGYTRIIGYIQKRLVPFWRQLGFIARPQRTGFRFSDYDYVECERLLPARNDALHEDSDPFVIMRPEGDWDEENVLDRSAKRPVPGVVPPVIGKTPALQSA